MRKGRLLASTIVFAAACASAGKEQGGDDQPGIDAKGSDATDAQVSDGPDIDAAPVAVTLSQTTGNTVAAASSVACGANGTTSENSWYRAFKLADHNIAGAFNVTAVSFGIQEATGLPNVQVKVGTYSGAVTPAPAQLDTTLVTPLNAVTYAIPNTASTATTTVTVPITATVPAGGTLLVEVFSPDLSGTGKYFYLGGNTTGETKPAYLRAPACSTTQPRTTVALGFPTANLVLSVNGTK